MTFPPRVPSQPRRSRIRPWHIVVAVVGVVVLCFGGFLAVGLVAYVLDPASRVSPSSAPRAARPVESPTAAAPSPPPASAAVPSPAAAQTAPPSDTKIAPPRPGPQAWAAYIRALTAIDPDIVHGKEDKAVDRGRDQCTSVKQWPNDRAKLVDLTNRRFISPNHPDGFGIAKAEKILDAVRAYICPGW